MKVLDWTDEEPLIGILFMTYLDKVMQKSILKQNNLHRSESLARLQKLLFELYKRVLSLHQVTGSKNNLSHSLTMSRTLLLLRQRLTDESIRDTIPTLAFDNLKPLI